MISVQIFLSMTAVWPTINAACKRYRYKGNKNKEQGVGGLREIKKKHRKKGLEGLTGYAMIAPFFILLTLFVIIPIIINIFLSFTNYNMREITFVGLRNYRDLFKDKLFGIAFKNTLFYTVFNVIFTMIISFFLAVFLNRNSWVTKFTRSCMYIPYVTSMVVAAMIWLWMYEPSGGVFNEILKALGLQPVNWLLQKSTALPCIIAMNVWKGIGYNMVLFLAALQGVPASLYEAAAMDGAKGWTKIRYITIPMIQPIIFFVFITNIINSFNDFESVTVMTSGGPLNSTTTLVHQIYTRSFTEYKVGYGSAIAMVLSVFVLLFTFLSFRFGSQGNDTGN